MNNWDEIRTAFYVAREGTVSGAAEHLGIHHATVIRHIDALEARLKAKLFQRHARGYTPTEAGAELLRVAQGAHDRFNQLDAYIRGRSDAVEGEIIITSLVSLAPRIIPQLKDFQEAHPAVSLRYLASERVFRLEYGEAHVAIRAGTDAPEEPDNIVQYLCEAPNALYASRAYVEKHGAPASEAEFATHRFIGSAQRGTRAPFYRWMNETLDDELITFRSDNPQINDAAIAAGLGIGFLADGAEKENDSLVQIMPPRPEWASKLWLVTHMDLHRAAKVQALSRFLKERLGAGAA